MKIGHDDKLAIEKLLFQGVLCEAYLEKVSSWKKVERECFMALRKIQSHAWQSISHYKNKCAAHERVSAARNVKRKLLELADLRAKKLLEAEERLPGGDQYGPGPHLGAFYRYRASNSRCERLLDAFAEIEKHRGKPLPANWESLIFKLRAFFFETGDRFEDRTKIEPRDVLKVHPRLRDYAHRGALSSMLDVFNVYNYLRLVVGQNEKSALSSAAMIVLPRTDPEESLIVGKTYKKRFEQTFSAS